MSKTVFNQKDDDFTKEPMFFGEDGGVQRYDTFKYPQFDKLNQTMIGYFWRPEEVSLQKDRSDYAQFRPEQKHIFTANLKYQTLLELLPDSEPDWLNLNPEALSALKFIYVVVESFFIVPVVSYPVTLSPKVLSMYVGFVTVVEETVIDDIHTLVVEVAVPEHELSPYT